MIVRQPIPNSTYSDIESAVTAAAASAPNLASLQQRIVELLSTRLSHYHWTGFYMLDPMARDTLVLGAFNGAPTTHVRIPVSEGICGAAVAQAKTIVIDDVQADPRYLACSIETKSEIVVPIRAFGVIVGEIDIDSHDPAAFTPADRGFLEQCATIVGQFIERSDA